VALSFRVLGSLEVWRDDRTVVVGAAKQRALLGLLLIRRSEVGRDVLVDALWGERPPAGARNTLQVYVSKLRRVLGQDAIVTTPAGYRLDLVAGAVDADRFEELFEQGRQALAPGHARRALPVLQEAESLWRGAAYSDLRYETFVQAEAGRLDELRLTCVEERLQAQLELGGHAQLVGELEALVVEHPLRERFRSQLILALYRSGRQTEALAHYQATRRMLSDELGLEPSPELRELERMILAHDPALGVTRDVVKSRSNVPHQPTPFIGREHELAELVAVVRDGSRRLVTLTGPGGTGKTRLAIEAASLLVADFEAGVWWVPLQSLRDARLVSPAIAAALELPGGELTAQVGDARMLLVLDNFEQLLDAGVETASLLSRCPNLRLLVTSREPLHVAAEREVRVPPMTETDAVALFDERAGQIAHGDSVVDDGEVVAEICRRLDCLPLPVELAAARTKLFTARQILSRLNRRLTLLTRGPRDAPARQQALRATIEWSYDLLEPDERQLLRDLSVFVGGCSYESGEAIASAGPDTLESLLDKSLVQRRESEIDPRYSMLETIREFARQLSEATGEWEMQCRRHAEWFLARAEQTGAATEGGEIPPWNPWAWFRDELPNVRVAIDWAIEAGEMKLAHALAAAPGPWLWLASGATNEGELTLTRVLEQTGSMAPRDHGRILAALGNLAGTRSEYAEAEAFDERAIVAFEQAGDFSGAFRTCCHLVRVLALARRVDIEEVRSRLDSASASHAVTSDYDRAQICLSEAYIEWVSGGFSRAQELIEEELVLLAGAGRPRSWDIGQLANLARFALKAGDLKRAKSACLELLAQDAGIEAILVCYAQVQLGLVALREKNRDEAADRFSEALGLARPMGAVLAIAEGLYGAAVVATMDGDNERAVRLWTAADSVGRRTPVAQPDQFLVDHGLEPARSKLSAETLASARAAGAVMTPNEAINYALEGLACPGGVAEALAGATSQLVPASTCDDGPGV